MEGKSYGKIMVIKNAYLKCKIIDVHVNKDFLNFVTYFGKVIDTLHTQRRSDVKANKKSNK